MNLQSVSTDVCILNNLFENSGNSAAIRPFSLKTDGAAMAISFLSQPIWCSEEDERQEDESEGSPDGFEPLIDFLIREANKLLENMPKQIKMPK